MRRDCAFSTALENIADLTVGIGCEFFYWRKGHVMVGDDGEEEVSR